MFEIRRIYYKVFIVEVSCNNAITSNNQSKSEFSFVKLFTLLLRGKNQENFRSKGIFFPLREFEEEGGSYSFHPKYTRPLFYEET